MRTNRTGLRVAMVAALIGVGLTGAGCRDWGRPGHDSDHHGGGHHRGDHGNDHGDDHRGPG